MNSKTTPFNYEQASDTYILLGNGERNFFNGEDPKVYLLAWFVCILVRLDVDFKGGFGDGDLKLLEYVLATRPPLYTQQQPVCGRLGQEHRHTRVDISCRWMNRWWM